MLLTNGIYKIKWWAVLRTRFDINKYCLNGASLGWFACLVEYYYYYFLGQLFETGGDDVLSVIMNDYGKPTHAQHIYLPYYQGRNLLRKL